MNTTDDIGHDLEITKTDNTRQVVANFDHGWDLEPTTDDAREIIGFFAAGIAEHSKIAISFSC